MRGFIAAALVVAGLGWAGDLRAQTKDDLARADALFNAGKALTDSGQFTDACAKFAESKRLAPGLGVTMYLADCYEHIGRTASAWTEFRSAEGLARERNDKRADLARGRAEALEPRLLRLTIVLAPQLPRAGLQVLRDGVQIGEEELGLAVPVDPGGHVIVVSAPGHPTRTYDSQVGPENAVVHVDSLDEAAPATSASPGLPPVIAPNPSPVVDTTSPPSASLPTEPAPASRPTPDPGATRRWWGVGVGAVGVVGVALGAVFGGVAISKRNESNAGGPNAPCDSTDHCDNTGLSLRQNAKSAADLSTVAFIVGGVALAGGAVLYLTAPRRSSTTGLVVIPAVGASSAGAVLQATF